MVSVARWLDTFTCSKYADRFERLGYSTLQSICQLTSTQLQNLGVPSADIYIIMENVLLLKQSVNSLHSPRYLDLTSQPPSQIHNINSSRVVNNLLLPTEATSFNDFLPPQSSSDMIYHNSFYNTHPARSYSSNQQQFIRNPSKSTINEPHSHPLESLERLVFLPDSQVLDPKSVVNPSSPILTTPIVSNLLTNEKSFTEQQTNNINGTKRCLTNDEQNEFNKKIRINTHNDIKTADSITNNHPVVTSLLTRSLNNNTVSQTLLPSITSLHQKH